jgi:hypothetical protein
MDLSECCTSSWKRCEKVLRESHIICDTSFLSALKWSKPGGVASLYKSGSTITLLPSDQLEFHSTKVVCLLSTHLSANVQLFRDITASGAISELHIITGYSEQVHINELYHDDTLTGRWIDNTDYVGNEGYFETIDRKLRQWISNANPAIVPLVSVRYEPLCASILNQQLFLLPSLMNVSLNQPGTTRLCRIKYEWDLRCTAS